MISIRFLNSTPVADMHYSALATVGILEDTPFPIEKLDRWVERTVQAEHSILNDAVLQITDDACRSDVCSQLVRHTDKMPRHYVQSFRPDWTKQPRPKDPAATRLYVSTWPADSLLRMARQRLCFRAMHETREKVLAIKKELRDGWFPDEESDLLAFWLSMAMVPSCVYRCGCPEGKRNCGWWDRNKGKYLNKSITERWEQYAEDSK